MAMRTCWLAAIVVVLNSLLASCATGGAWAQGEPPFGTREEIPSHFLPSDEALKTVIDGIRNPSFDSVRGDNLPEIWERTNNPIVLEESLPGGGTNRYLRLNLLHQVTQPILYPVSRWQTVTVASRVRSELSSELPRYLFATYDAAKRDQQFRDITRAPGETSDWRPFYGSVTRRAQDDMFSIVLRTRQDVAWVDYDDFFLLTEELSNGGFDGLELGEAPRDRWLLSNGAEIVTANPLPTGGRSLLLPPGAAAERLVAHSPFVVQYFLTGVATAPFTAGETRLDTRGLPIDAPTTGTIVLGAGDRFLFDVPRTNTGEAAHVLLRNDGPEPVVVDDVSRGWAYAWPPKIAVAPNSPSPRVRLAAAWPGRLLSAEIAILDSEGEEQLRLDNLLRDSTTVWREFDGATLPSGVYTARFILRDDRGVELHVDRTFTLTRPAPFPVAPMAADLPRFARIAWVFIQPLDNLEIIQTPEQVARIMRWAREDGFDTMLFFALPAQLPLIAEAAAEVEMPFLVHLTEIPPMVRDVHGNNTYDAHHVYDQLQIYDSILDSPWFQGIYIYDEPNTAGQIINDRLQQLMVVMERSGKYPIPYSFQNPNPPIEGTRFPVVSTFEYPIRHWNQSGKAMLLNSIENMANAQRYATSINRPFWAGVQGFGTMLTNQAAIMMPEEVSAQLGMILAIGARSYYVFVYKTLGPYAAPRGPGGEESKRLPPFRDFNRRVAEMEDLILSLEPERIIPSQEDIFVRIARNQTGESYAIAVNYDPQAIANVEAVTSSATRLLNVETGEATDASTTHTLTLGPGQWTVLRIEDGSTDSTWRAELVPVIRSRTAPVREIATIQTDQGLDSISINPNGLSLAGIARGVSTMRVYDLAEDNFGALLHDRFFVSSRGSVKYLEPDLLAQSSRSFGATIFEQAGAELIPRYRYNRQTGGARSVLLDAPNLWIAQSYWGVTRIHFQGTDEFEREGLVRSQDNDFLGLHGPYGDKRVLAIQVTRGLYHIDDTPEGFTKTRLTRRATYNEAHDWQRSRLAIPMTDGALHIFDLDQNGDPVNEFVIDDPVLVEPTQARWIDDELLALSDPRFGIHFYRIHNNGFWFHLGMWKPQEDIFIITSYDVLPGGQAAVSLGDGRIILLDMSPMIDYGRVSGWVVQ